MLYAQGKGILMV